MYCIYEKHFRSNIIVARNSISGKGWLFARNIVIAGNMIIMFKIFAEIVEIILILDFAKNAFAKILLKITLLMGETLSFQVTLLQKHCIEV